MVGIRRCAVHGLPASGVGLNLTIKN
jgi:hypothetical protein